MSELQVLEGGSDVTSSATKTSSSAPVGGALADIFDGSLSTRNYWTQAVAQDAGFWIKFDFSGGDKDIRGVKQGGYDQSDRYMSAFSLQYSDDNSEWFTLGSKSGLSYPGNNTLSGEYSFIPERMRNALTVNYWIGERVNQQLIIHYGAHITQQLAVNYWIGERAAQQLIIHYGKQVLQQFVMPCVIAEPVRNDCIVDAKIYNGVRNACELNYEISAVDRLVQQLRMKLPILDAVPVVITQAVTATISGQTVIIENATVSLDEGRYAWTCSVTLFDPNQYGLFTQDEPFTVHLPGEDYEFIVDSKTLSRNSIVDIAATVSGIGLGAVYASPRAAKITRTWDTAVLASAVASELFGSVVDWQILDWSIPAFRLGAQNQTPIEILQRIAQAAGATVDGLADGTLVVRYLFPVSVPNFDAAASDQEYLDSTHNFNLNENIGRDDLVNKLRIIDVEPGAGSDTIEFEQDADDPTRGQLRVFPSPWRTEITLEHTADAARVSATQTGVETEEFTEIVEVIAGKGSVSKPIHQVVTLDWLVVNLTGIAFEADSREFTTTNATLKESLLQITYRTRYVAFDAAAFPDASVQFIVREPA